MFDAPAHSRLTRVEFLGELRADNLLDWAITALTGWLFLVAVWSLGGYLPFGVPLAKCAPIAGAILALHGISILARRGEVEFHPWAIPLVPWVLWNAIRTWWGNPAPWLGEEQLLLVGITAAVGWTTFHNQRTKEQTFVVLSCIVAAAMVALVAALYQVLKDPGWLPYGRRQADQYVEDARFSGTFGIPNTFAGYLAVVFTLLVVAAAARRFSVAQRAVLGVLAIGCLAGIVLSISRGALLSLVPVIVLLPVFTLRHWIQRVVGVGVTVLVLGGCGWWLLVESDSFRERFESLQEHRGEVTRPKMWKAAFELFKTAPIAGRGLGSYEVLIEEARPEGFNMAPRYAHNDYLNTLADLGLVGAVLTFGSAGFLLVGAAAAWRRTPFLAIPIGGEQRITPQAKILLGWALLGMTAFGLHLLVDFHLKLIATSILAITVLANAGKLLTKVRIRVERRVIRVALGGTFIVLGAWIGLRGHVVGTATAEYFFAEEQLNLTLKEPRAPRHGLDHLERLRGKFERVVEALPGHADAWARLGVTRQLEARFHPEERNRFFRAAVEDIERARALADHWLYDVYEARALWSMGAPEEQVLALFEEAGRKAPRRADPWYYRAVVLSRMPGREAEARAALEGLFALDPSHEAGKTLESRLTSP